MRTIFQYLIPLALLTFAVLMFTGTVSSNGLYDGYQRLISGVRGRPGEASHKVTTRTSIATIEGTAYAGRLDASITFMDAEGAATEFDLHYPDDFNRFHDGFGPLWLANWRSDIANNPQVTPVLGNTCLQTIRGENLAPAMRYRTGYREYLVCRLLDEEGPDAPRSYDIRQARPAVVGVIWANRNHQPLDIPRERCVAEVRIWATEIAKPEDRFMACILVVSGQPAEIQVHSFELTGDHIAEIGGAGERWPRKPVKMRDATRLAQYRLMQNWLQDADTHAAAVGRAQAHIAANLDQIIPNHLTQFDDVDLERDVVNFTFRARDTKKMTRIRDGSSDGADRHLFGHIRSVVCGSDERAALLAFQENAATYTYDLNRRDGRPMTRFATFPNFLC